MAIKLLLKEEKFNVKLDVWFLERDSYWELLQARINGGEWASVEIKQNSAVWTGTSRHSASLHLAAVAGGSSVKVDFYVTRNGSSYGGDAGKLGTASQPKSYQFTMN